MPCKNSTSQSHNAAYWLNKVTLYSKRFSKVLAIRDMAYKEFSVFIFALACGSFLEELVFQIIEILRRCIIPRAAIIILTKNNEWAADITRKTYGTIIKIPYIVV